jgi:hypothetical protein
VTALRDTLIALAISTPFLVGASVSADQDGDVVVRMKDPRIVESSGLVVDGDVAVTVNDSGHDPVVYAVDLTTGRTVGTTGWPGDGVDVEALAPAGPGELWVGDIGDNLGVRDAVEVTRVPYGSGDREVDGESYLLAYPGGPRDAEALLAHPVSGRLYVVSKDVFGGGIFAAPANLSDNSVNHLRQLGDAPAVVTDAAFFPDGEHLILRNYAAAAVLTFPGLEQVGSFALPRQQQGEGIAVSPDGRIFLSSEGARSPLLVIELPRQIAEEMGTGSPEPGPDRGPTQPVENEPAEDDDATSADEFQREPWPWVAGGLLGLAAVVVLVRSLRPR